jgi:hypothetical protein
MYRILWHDREGENVSIVAYPTIAEAVRVAGEVREAYCACCRPGYDVVFAANSRIVPDWFRQMNLEHVD